MINYCASIIKTHPQTMQRKESKFVSIFSDSRPDSDISFRDAAQGLLKKSAEKYVVGVDNLTVSMDGLSMLDQGTAQVVLEVLVLKHAAANADVFGATANWLDFPSGFRYADSQSYQLRNDGPNITTFADIIGRLNQVAARVDANLRAGSAVITDLLTLEVAPITATPAGEARSHLEFFLDVTGRLRVAASRLFWATHVIHIPEKKYQRIFLGTDWDTSKDQRIISLKPWEPPNFGNLLSIGGFPVPVDTNVGFSLFQDKGYARRWAEIEVARYNETIAGTAWSAYIKGASAASRVWSGYSAAFRYLGNLYSTLDRRVCIEVGTSLPLENSPLVEDNVEANDYILRALFHKPGCARPDGPDRKVARNQLPRAQRVQLHGWNEARPVPPAAGPAKGNHCPGEAVRPDTHVRRCQGHLEHARHCASHRVDRLVAHTPSFQRNRQ